MVLTHSQTSAATVPYLLLHELYEGLDWPACKQAHSTHPLDPSVGCVYSKAYSAYCRGTTVLKRYDSYVWYSGCMLGTQV
jgi:hypothetical protein